MVSVPMPEIDSGMVPTSALLLRSSDCRLLKSPSWSGSVPDRLAPWKELRYPSESEDCQSTPAQHATMHDVFAPLQSASDPSSRF